MLLHKNSVARDDAETDNAANISKKQDKSMKIDKRFWQQIGNLYTSNYVDV